MNNKNFAPKEIEGTYTVTIDDNKVNVIKHRNGKNITVRCHPEDKFDLGKAMNIAMEKLNEIRIGDIVEIVDPKSGFATSTEIFEFNNPKHFEYALRRRYGVFPKKGAHYKVVDIYTKRNTTVYIVENKVEKVMTSLGAPTCVCVSNPVYAMGRDGIKKVVDEN